jgi:superfamily I DNA/RNA helicase
MTPASTVNVFSLSTEQERVVNHRGGHLQVIACAGAGKTEAISRRVSSLILEGTEPNQIVAFTFTERAAQSLCLGRANAIKALGFRHSSTPRSPTAKSGA